MGRHRRRMKREEIRELKAFPMQMGVVTAPDDAWFSLGPQLGSRELREEDDDLLDEDEGADTAAAGLTAGTALGDASGLADEDAQRGEGRTPVAM